jgi:hypothetical protein
MVRRIFVASDAVLLRWVGAGDGVEGGAVRGDPNRYAQVTVRQCYYSVPARLIGARVRVSLSAEDLRIFDGSTLVATHPRLTTRGASDLVLDHYLVMALGGFRGSVQEGR